MVIHNLACMAVSSHKTEFDFERQYLHQEELYGLYGRPAGSLSSAGSSSCTAAAASMHWGLQVSSAQGLLAIVSLTATTTTLHHHHVHGYAYALNPTACLCVCVKQWVLLKFEAPVTAPKVWGGRMRI